MLRRVRVDRQDGGHPVFGARGAAWRRASGDAELQGKRLPRSRREMKRRTKRVMACDGHDGCGGRREKG